MIGFDQKGGLRKITGSWQKATGQFLVGSVLRTKRMLPKHALDMASAEDRVAIWRTIHDRAPLAIVRGIIDELLRSEAQIVSVYQAESFADSGGSQFYRQLHRSYNRILCQFSLPSICYHE